ncbi:hypothetical protein KIN20_015855 [Parelaphostrongylus tenuis]|nr:hypothetical protein KIN20_015855 [Parelaphostrongylus tenuis]
MVYSDSGTAAQVAGNSRTAGALRGLVMRSIMQAVSDVLEQQGRAAGLSDFVITFILNQLTVSITYAPLECKRVVVISGNEVMTMNMKPTCTISGNTVTSLCNHDATCMISGGAPEMMLADIPPEHKSISGTLSI